MSAEWLIKNNKKVSPLGKKAASIVSELYSGIYHVSQPALQTDWSDAHKISICVPDTDFATYDGDKLTRLVILAHKYNVRASIAGASYRRIRITFVNVTKYGFFRDNHPSTDELIAKVVSEVNR